MSDTNEQHFIATMRVKRVRRVPDANAGREHPGTRVIHEVMDVTITAATEVSLKTKMKAHIDLLDADAPGVDIDERPKR